MSVILKNLSKALHPSKPGPTGDVPPGGNPIWAGQQPPSKEYGTSVSNSRSSGSSLNTRSSAADEEIAISPFGAPSREMSANPNFRPNPNTGDRGDYPQSQSRFQPQQQHQLPQQQHQLPQQQQPFHQHPQQFQQQQFQQQPSYQQYQPQFKPQNTVANRPSEFSSASTTSASTIFDNVSYDYGYEDDLENFTPSAISTYSATSPFGNIIPTPSNTPSPAVAPAHTPTINADPLTKRDEHETHLLQEIDRLRKQVEQESMVKSGIRSEMLKLHTELEGSKIAQLEAQQKVDTILNELQQEREARGRAVMRLNQLQKERDQLKSQYEQLIVQFEQLKAEKTRINDLPEVAIKLSTHLEQIVQKFDAHLCRLEKLPLAADPPTSTETSAHEPEKLETQEDQ